MSVARPWAQWIRAVSGSVAGSGQPQGLNSEDGLGSGLALLLPASLQLIRGLVCGRFFVCAISDAKKVVGLEVSLHLKLPVVVIALSLSL